MKPEWDPPVGFRDPIVRRLLAPALDPDRPEMGRAKWSRIIRGRIPEFREVAVVLTVSGYANRDGSSCHPGVARLVEDLQSSDKTIRRSLDWLSEHGWLTVIHRGRRKLREANVYTLSIPAPVAAELGLWRETQGGDVAPQWLERPETEPKRPDVAINSGRRKPPFPPVIRDRKKPVLAVTDEVLAVAPGGSSGRSSDLPPGPSHQVLEDHHSASVSRPHAPARGRIKTITEGLDPDDPEVAELLAERIEEQLGYPLGGVAFSRLFSMLGNGRGLDECVAVGINDPEGARC